MAPALDPVDRILIGHMLQEGFDTRAIAANVGCSPRAVQRIRREQERAVSDMPRRKPRRGRRSCITPAMKKALYDMLIEEPYLYIDELAENLHEQFGKKVPLSSVALAVKDWPRKKMRYIAQQRDEDLRDFYLYTLGKLDIESWMCIYVDESGCDARVRDRRFGRSPKGTTPVKTTKLRRGNRWQILPAYTQDGVLMHRVYQGSTDTHFFEDFLAELLHFCGRYPEPNSVIIMDNASWHHSEKIQQMCEEAGVKIIYLPPYSPDFNPIEEYFSVLKKFIQKDWIKNKEVATREQEFGMYLDWSVRVVGDDGELAKSLFRHAGMPITQAPSQ
ncbi:hypothetical protein HJFPF1_13485 [Paramyrothecium foliicola]|nr:hypothetical protein HJFPF1_13485 [Paramyrothecium foliicola]